MKQANDLFLIVKQQLRLHGITYKMLAEKLNLSEPSIKRIFTQKDISLSRLESICSCFYMSVSDVFALLEKSKERILYLTESQEQELVSETELLLVAICILNHWTFQDILKFYKISEHALIRYAARLDQMKIIELQPNNHFKRLIDPHFHWIPDGPIQRFFQRNVQKDFFDCHFEKPTELYLVRSGMLSEQDNLNFQKILNETAKEFVKLCRDSVHIPIDKRQGSALIIAMRPWVPQIFDSLKR
ncbi:helix-turn-helix transcriptional regulator [Legionella geestiana]|uniref:helix-turn-helix domain-containing protein n=1 Tax=Legionella geestiana TaxID=45065 RepID=UPI0010918C08|nr:helix-turn-helix transcriptional regulator [Legionella geestiana]QDQ39446.1 helix-turn-helix transcriptional regulator [Legionella geestiana]